MAKQEGQGDKNDLENLEGEHNSEPKPPGESKEEGQIFKGKESTGDSGEDESEISSVLSSSEADSESDGKGDKNSRKDELLQEQINIKRKKVLEAERNIEKKKEKELRKAKRAEMRQARKDKN